MAMIPTVPIVRAGHDDVDPLADMMTAAFYRNPDVEATMPDPGQRATALNRFARALLHLGVDIGYVDTTADREAAALWWANDFLDPSDYQRLVEENCDPYAGPVNEFAEYLATHAPQEQHFYLAFLGVHPTRQRQGLGSALLDYRHKLLDNLRQPAYLVATTPASRDLYLKHGYTLCTAQPLQPEGGPPLWPMWRAGASPLTSPTRCPVGRADA